MLEEPSGVGETHWRLERAGTCPEPEVVCVLSIFILCAVQKVAMTVLKTPRPACS